MDDKLKFDTINYAAYKNAKPARPAWATALIVAGVIALAGVFTLFIGGPPAWIVFLAAGVTAVVAGVLALTGMRRAA